MSAQYDAFTEALEKAALTTADCGPQDDIRNLALSSIAVSLKRIADELEQDNIVSIGKFKGEEA